MTLTYLVIEYLPRRSPAGSHTPIRQDGHYLHKEDAISLAKAWLAEKENGAARIAVVKIEWCDDRAED